MSNASTLTTLNPEYSTTSNPNSVPRASFLLSLAAALILLGVPLAHAQEDMSPPPPPPGPPEVGQRLDRMMAELTEELKLTAEQVGPVRELLASRMKEQREIFEDRRAKDRSSREEMRASMMKLREENDVKVRELLDEEQAAAYDKFIETHRRRRGGPGMRRGRGRGRD